MNALIQSRLDGEIIAPDAMVSVFGTTHPLNAVAGSRIARRVKAGLSIAEILHESLSDRPGHDASASWIVTLGDGLAAHEIAPANFHRIRVKPGTTLTFRPRLGGGAARTVLTLVVAVAAIVLAAPTGGLSLGLLAATGIPVAIGSALIAGGIMLAGTLAINALFPIRPPEAQDTSSKQLNSIQGAQNQANPFGPVPVVLGTHRQSPYYAARPFTEIVGDDQYLRLLFCMGYGPLGLTNFRIGETPLSSFSDYEIEVRQGFGTDTAVTIYPGEVDEVALQITLEPSVWNSQTTVPDTDEISWDVTATQGLVAVDPQGDPVPYEVTIAVQYRPAAGGGWLSAPNIVFTRSNDPMRRGWRIAVTRGQYEVRLQRTTAYLSRRDLVKDVMVWTALRSLKSAAPIVFPQHLALIALRIRATDQLSGVISTFNCDCASLVNAYSGSGSTWNADTASSNPADLFRHVLQGPANARPQGDVRVDVSNLQAWWGYCYANGFAYNEVINSVGSVYDKLCDIAAAGRAVPTWIDGTWGVVWDRPTDPIVQHFTPRNSWGFKGDKPYVQQPHGWRVKFINAANGYTSDERIVYDDGYSSSNATLFEGIQFPGVTDPALIWKHGRFHIAQSRLRPEKITLQVGWDHLVCTRGDRVRVTHDVLLIGLAFGRVKSVAGQVVTLDETVTIAGGKTYGVQFRVPEDVRIIDRAVDPGVVAGDYTMLTLVGDLTGIVPGNLFAFGETEQESADYRVQAIAHQGNLIATLTLVDDAPEISQADTGTIPDYDPHVTIPADPFTLPPRDLRYLELIDGRGQTARALVHLTWQVPRFGKIASFQVQDKSDDVGGPWTNVASILPPHTSADIPYGASGVWSFRVRCIFTDGTASDWISLLGLSLQGLTFAPSDVTNLHQHAVDGRTVLDWTIVDDPRAILYEVRKGSSWDTGLVVGDVVAQPPWPTTGDGTYHVKAYVLTPFGVRVYSPDAASIAIAGSIFARNILRNNDEQAAGWPGRLQGGVIDGSFIRTDVSAAITEAWAAEIVSTLELTGIHIAVYASAQTVDIGRAAECRFWTEYEASGILIGDDFLAKTDVLADGDILGTSPTRFIQAFPVWRFATDGSTDIFAPSDIFAPTDVFTADIHWGDWVAIPSGTRVERFFQPGYVLITNDAATNATGTKFSWFVDVPDRNDDYTALAVPDTGLSVTFYSGGYNATPTPGATAVPFNGGPNNAPLPHVQRAIVNGTNGDEVKITSLTLTGCTVFVVNAGSNVTRSGVNLLVRGF